MGVISPTPKPPQIPGPSVSTSSIEESAAAYTTTYGLGREHDVTNSAPVANQAFYYPFVVHAPTTVYRMSTIIVTQSGNLDMGVYDEGLNRLVSTGSIAMTAAGLQMADVTDTPIQPGRYYMAISVNNTTARFRTNGMFSFQLFRVCGGNTQASAFPLPATATFDNGTTFRRIPFVAVQFRA